MPAYFKLCFQRNLKTTLKTNSRKHKRILCWLFLRLTCSAIVMENADIITAIGKIWFYIYASIQIIEAAIRSCSLRHLFQKSWKKDSRKEEGVNFEIGNWGTSCTVVLKKISCKPCQCLYFLFSDKALLACTFISWLLSSSDLPSCNSELR